MTYQELGFTDAQEAYRIDQGLDSFDKGRVISEHKESYIVKTPEQEYHAEVIGSIRFTATDRYDLPAVGDWVAFSPYDEDKALIHAIYPRSSILERKAAGKSSHVQIICN